MTVYLLTWNPGKHDEDVYDPWEWIEHMVIPVRAGQQPEGLGWTVALRLQNFEQNATVFMLRQGDHGRGLVAKGFLTGEVEVSEHWEDATQQAKYVGVTWESAVPVSDGTRLDIDTLRRLVPEFDFSKVYYSGRSVPDDVGDVLCDLWDKHVKLPHVEAGTALECSDAWRTYLDTPAVELTR